ncbi:MAG: tetratricopeptide repeat protein [Pseudomonadota bacterium]|nr:tetratricopeptide repeat protein [Pseudomonadota bacterium]
MTFYNLLQRLKLWALVASTVILVFGSLSSQRSATANSHLVDPPSSRLGDFLAGYFAESALDGKAAIGFFRSNLAANPDNKVTQTKLLSILVSEGKINSAIPLAKKLIETNAPNLDLAILLVALDELLKGDCLQARIDLAKLPDTGVTAYAVPVIEAWCLIKENKQNKAIQLLEIKMTNPGTVAFFGPHASLIAERANKTDQAIRYMENTIKYYRRIGANLTRLFGGLLDRNKMYSRATQLYKDYNRLNPSSSLFDAFSGKNTNDRKASKTPISIQEGISEALFSLSRSVTSQSPADAIIFNRLAIHMNPAFTYARLQLAETMTRNGKLEEAISLYKSLSKDPVFGWTSKLQMARNHNFLDEFDSATKILEKMAREETDRFEPLEVLGTMYRSRKKYSRATRAFEAAKKRVIKWEFKHWKLLYGNAASLERLKKWPAAEKDFLKAMQLNPNEPTLLNYLGYSWVEQGIHLKKAKKMIETAVQQRPRAGYIVDSLGWVQYQTGEFKKALKNLERAILLSPSDPTINDHLGDVYWRVGRQLEARFQWLRALSFEPEKEQIPVIKKKLEKGLSGT